MYVVNLCMGLKLTMQLDSFIIFELTNFEQRYFGPYSNFELYILKSPMSLLDLYVKASILFTSTPMLLMLSLKKEKNIFVWTSTQGRNSPHIFMDPSDEVCSTLKCSMSSQLKWKWNLLFIIVMFISIIDFIYLIRKNNYLLSYLFVGWLNYIHHVLWTMKFLAPC